jgi:hypothetical protein
MEKLKIESSLEQTHQTEVTMQDIQESIVSEIDCPKIKPRALIFKATDKDLNKIKKLIETQFAEVEIIYVTTGSAASILRVTKSMPFETQNSSAQPFYTIE